MSKKSTDQVKATSNVNWDDGTEVESNWFKFENVGDHIIGTLLTRHLQKSNDPNFTDQWVYEIKTDTGAVFNVGISVNKPGTFQRLNNCALGEIVGIRYDSDGEASKKGFHPPKILKVKSFGMDAEYQANKPVSEDDIPDM